jgi:hypothetical protein
MEWSKNRFQTPQVANTQLKVIVKIKQAKHNEHQIKATFKNSMSRELKVNEMVYSF